MAKINSILRQLFFDFLTTEDRHAFEMHMRAAMDADDIAQVEARYAEYIKSIEEKDE
jgi:hypothetical protein